jgi:hypothetical protein
VLIPTNSGFSDITTGSTIPMPISSSVKHDPLSSALTINTHRVESGWRTCDLLDGSHELPTGAELREANYDRYSMKAIVIAYEKLARWTALLQIRSAEMKCRI